MTPLADLLRRRIAATGPLSVAEFMGACLLHPEHGYYISRAPFGRDGDFITAPEITQMFGELLGLCLAQAWIEQGRPAPFCLAELGPGRGTLMADLWRATKSVPGFHEAAQLWLIEASPGLRAQQKRALTGAAPRWAESVLDLPPMPLFLIANEFFDALPIRQFQRGEEGWCERMIGLEGDRLTLGLAPESPVPALAHRLEDTGPGMLVEQSPQAAPLITEITGRIAAQGGAALVIDYGDWRSRGDTLQALHRHAPAGILEAPGRDDLTAHVDFEALAQAAAPGSQASALTSQSAFLHGLGLGARAQTLAERLSGEALTQHLAAYHRLTDGAEMGTLFKVIGFTAAGAPPIPGLQPQLV